MDIYWGYSGATDGYSVYMDGEQVYFTKDKYKRDMFIAELKARIKLMKQEKGDTPTP